MKYQKLYALMLVVILCMPLVSALTFTSTADIGISDTARVKVSLLNQDPDPVEPGEIVTVRFKAENFGAWDMQNVDFRLVTSYPFTVVTPASGIVNLGTLYGRQIDDYAMTLEWELKVADDAVEGEHDVRIEYKADGWPWTRLSSEMIEVRTYDANIDVVSVETEPKRVSSGSEVEVTIVLENQADSTLRDVEASLDLPDNFAPTNTGSKKLINELGSGQQVKFTYNLIVDKDAESKVHKIPLEITYYDEVGEEYSNNMSVGVIVENPARYVLNLEESDIYMSGNKGKVVASFSGVGFSDINFVRLTLEESEQYEILSTPLVYLGNVEPDDFQTAEYEIYVHGPEEGEEAESEAVTLPFTIEYTDDYNREVSKKDSLSFNVHSKDDAVKFGYETAQNPANMVVSLIVGILLLVFWLRMVIHAFRSKHEKGTKVMWIFLLFATNVVGAVLYYLFGRKSGN